MDNKALLYIDLAEKCLDNVRKELRSADLRRKDIPTDIKYLIKCCRDAIFQFKDDINKAERLEESSEEEK